MKALLIIYDNDSYIGHFPVSLAYVASVFLKCNISVEIYNQDIHHYSEEHLTNYLNTNKFDFVCTSCVGGYFPYRKLLKISEAINKSKQKPIYLLGGYGPAPEPAFFQTQTKADFVCAGEAEIELEKYLKGDGGYNFSFPSLVSNLDNINIPPYHLFNINYYRLYRTSSCSRTDFVMPILSGRGCKFNCNFCVKLEQGQRLRSSKHILQEIDLLVKQYNINYFTFVDDLLMSSYERTQELCETFLKYQTDNNLKFKWDCNGRLNYAKPDLLKLMKKSGCVFINYGIESFDDKILKNMKKALTVRTIEAGVENTKKEKINMGLNIIWGNIGDNEKTLEKSTNFLLKYDDCHQLRTIRPVTPYPGSPLYQLAIQKDFLDKKNPAKDFYENKHLNSDLLSINFTNLPDDKFHQLLYFSNKKLIENYFYKKQQQSFNDAFELYFNKNINFRGFRQV